jgi:hypothetical protein
MDEKWQIRIRKQYKLELEGDPLPNQVNWAENWRFRNSTRMDGKWNKYNTTARILIEKQYDTVLCARFLVTGCDNAVPPANLRGFCDIP